MQLQSDRVYVHSVTYKAGDLRICGMIEHDIVRDREYIDCGRQGHISELCPNPCPIMGLLVEDILMSVRVSVRSMIFEPSLTKKSNFKYLLINRCQ